MSLKDAITLAEALKVIILSLGTEDAEIIADVCVQYDDQIARVAGNKDNLTLIYMKDNSILSIEYLQNGRMEMDSSLTRTLREV